MKNSLFAYPGNKRRDMQQLKLNLSFETGDNIFIDPFYGSGSATIFIQQIYPLLFSQIIAAEADPAIRAIVHCLSDPELHDKVTFYLGREVDNFLESPDFAWKDIVQLLDDVLLCGNITERSIYSLVDIAVTKLLYQRLAHGAAARTKADGKTLNVKYSKDKASKLNGWVPDLVPLYQYPVKPQMLSDYRSCFAQEVDYSKAICFIDPPYYFPKKTGCYPGHNPGDKATLELSTNSVSLALSRGCKQIFLFNYDNDDLSDYCYLEAKRYGYQMDVTPLAALRSLAYGRGNYKHGGRSEGAQKVEHMVWEFNKL